ncbi:DEAD/DEAH box helicase [Bacillus inaquosorum]|uniref:DEAD/DEAH box helicase n=1 Tax=Bacillus inaquosorum TaxID=483913 RepID=UPI000B43768C|nr:DEAD/DEAH box helicase [Bacillus inaquosorum]ARV45238.1 helicase [Bacillus subtilis]MEC2065330.1 DEAD/DEAH box helicase [Bacillus inaquosorum]MEC2083220.1 DEAD/DEAH box helicase [Bacillus inaquosorum]
MLHIKYLADKHAAQFLIENEQHLGWYEICRTCKELGQDVSLDKNNEIILPWWSFLSIRPTLNLLLRKHKIRLTADEEATRLLKLSLQREKTYNQAKEGQLEYSEEDVKRILRERNFRRNLTKHQLRNVTKLASLPSGATFSVPGAGKTTEALALYCLKKTEETKLLIVAPKNAFAAWEETLSVCMPESPGVVRLRGGARKVGELLQNNPQIMVINYQMLPNVLSEVASYLSTIPFFMFLDESHRIKRGNNGVHGRAVLSLAHLPEQKLIMSGTPLPNSTEDLVSQFNFLFPEVRVDKNTVVNHISPIYVRTTKEELDLPKPLYHKAEIPMSPAQRRLYDLMRDEELRQIELSQARDRNKLRAMGKSVQKLLQVSSNPSLLANSDFRHHELLKDVLLEGDTPKISYVCSRARELANQGRKVIIWSTFVQNIEQMASRLSDLGADYIHGGIDSGSEEEIDTREAKIKRFHDDPNCFVLIANPAAAGEGISLHTVCHDAIYIDRSYNAAHFLQSVDRIHRLGLSKEIETHVELVISPDSVDQSVERRLSEKINRMAEVLDDPSIMIEPEYADEEVESELSQQDIHDFVRHLRGES